MKIYQFNRYHGKLGHGYDDAVKPVFPQTENSGMQAQKKGKQPTL
jgi:hypothetical protein